MVMHPATRDAAEGLVAAVSGIAGLRVVGEPTGPLVAVATDDAAEPGDRVDPFLLIDAVRRRGFLLQAQPAMAQPDGSVLPRTAHLTITPVTARVLEDLVATLTAAADEVRGLPPAAPDPALAGTVLSDGLPDDLAVVMATLEALPAELVQPLLVEVLAATVDPAREGRSGR